MHPAADHGNGRVPLDCLVAEAIEPGLDGLDPAAS
jgi:hypothetical protein